MARSTYLAAFDQLQGPAGTEAHISALKQLRNEAIGHPERKSQLVQHGIVGLLTQTLQAAVKARGKRRDQKSNGTPLISNKQPVFLEEDEIRLQALLLLSSIAQGGPAFVAPVLAGSVVPLLLAALSPSQNPPKIVTASLKTLLALAEADRYAGPRSESLQKSSAMDTLYSKSTVRLYAEILLQRSQSSGVQLQLEHLYRFLSATCSEEYHCSSLTSGCILSLLGARLAAYHAHQRFFTTRIHSTTAAGLPPPPSHQSLPYLLSAITAIIGRAPSRISRLTLLPPINAVFPAHKPEAVNDSTFTHGQTAVYVNPIEYLIPRLQHKNETGFARAFPALGSTHATPRQSALTDLLEHGSNGMDGNFQYCKSESSLISWLIYTTRTEQGLLRLEAARLLAKITSLDTSRTRDRTIAYVILPLLITMLDEKTGNQSSTRSRTSQIESWIIKEQAPEVLEIFLMKNQLLQKAAAEAGLLKKVAALLKQSFETIEARPPAWLGGDASADQPTDQTASSRLGASGLKPELVHILKCRAGALHLLAAIADKEDRYRKQLTENGIVSNIIESLSPFRVDALADIDQQAYSASKQKIQPASVGNSIEVLLAACAAARALSRSVGLLRTSLIDAGLAKPIFALLKHPSVTVVKAATDVVCNTITEFSPMREDLVEAGAVKTLCEHAHSADSELRLVSLWALKHLMLKSPNDVKLSCFEELGTGWLIQIISGGNAATRPARVSSRTGMNAANAAGERIDILNAVDEPMDTTEDGVMSNTGINPAHRDPSNNGASISDAALIDDDILNFLVPSSLTSTDTNAIGVQYRARLKMLLDSDNHYYASNAYSDELKIQCQGLDFIRNMIFPPNAADMIDSLLQTLGASTIFDIVASKLKWPTTSQQPPVSSQLAQLAHLAQIAQEQWQQQQQQQQHSSSNKETAPSPDLSLTVNATAKIHDGIREVVTSAVHILVHIGAGAPRHRQLLISQPSLLRLLLPLLSHGDPGIREACVWVVINLTWVDEEADRGAAKQRALELRKLGFEEKLWEMREDEAVNVRERVSTAVDQFGVLLDVATGGQGRGAVGR